jgi:hypothetical protein
LVEPNTSCEAGHSDLPSTAAGNTPLQGLKNQTDTKNQTGLAKIDNTDWKTGAKFDFWNLGGEKSSSFSGLSNVFLFLVRFSLGYFSDLRNIQII